MSGNLLNTFLFNVNSFNDYRIEREPTGFNVSVFGVPEFAQVHFAEILDSSARSYIDIGWDAPTTALYLIVRLAVDHADSSVYNAVSTYSVPNTMYADARIENIASSSTYAVTPVNKDTALLSPMFATSSSMQTALYKLRPVYYQDYNVHTTYMYPLGGARVSMVRNIYLDDIEYIITSFSRESANIISKPSLELVVSESLYRTPVNAIVNAIPTPVNKSVNMDTTVFLLFSFMFDVTSSSTYDSTGEYFRGAFPETVSSIGTHEINKLNIEVGLFGDYSGVFEYLAALHFMSNGNLAIVVRSWINTDEPYGTIVIPLDPYL